MARECSGLVRIALLTVLIATVALESPALAVCHGDCSGDGGVSSAELRRVVAIVNLCAGNPAGCAAVSDADKQCTSADVDGSGKITAADLTRIVKDEVIGQNPDCAGIPLGTRVFTIKPRSGFAPASGFFSTGNNGSEVTESSTPPWYVGQSLKLQAGAVNPATGIATVRLQEDVVFGGQVIQGGPTLCIKLVAAGSSGQLDCDGGSPQDVLLSVDSNGGPCQPPAPCAAGPSVVTPFTGTTSRAGSLTLAVMASVANVSPKLSSPADCVNHVFGPPSPFYFTTEKATAEVTDISSSTVIRSCSIDTSTLCSLQGGCAAGKGTCSQTTVRFTRTGVPFNCAAWTTTDGPGRLYTPLFGEDADPVGDNANLLLIGDN